MAGRKMKNTTRKACGAFTLIEALMASVVLALTVSAAIVPFTCGMRSQSVESRQMLAVSLAEDLMEEIILKPFEEPDDGDEDPEPVSSFGPDGGESLPSSFSAIDDYDGYTEPDGQVLDPAGDVITFPAAAGISRHVTVSYVYVPGQDVTKPPNFFRVVVEVRYNGQPVVKLARLVHWIQ